MSHPTNGHLNESDCDTEEDFLYGVKYNISQYLSKNSFVPHKNGNAMNYGLNSFGCDSIINYNNDIWKFVWFFVNSNKAVYVNKNEEELILDTNNMDKMDIIRMMEDNKTHTSLINEEPSKIITV
jgi:hypothetical protein